MVQLMKSGNLGSEHERKPVKLEMEDHLKEEHGPLNKRCKLSMNLQEVCSNFVRALKF